MNKRFVTACVTGLATALTAVVAYGADDVQKAIAKLPDAVTKTFQQEFPQCRIDKLDMEVENGVSVYSLEFKDGAIQKETDLTADGTLLECTVVVDAKAVPAAVIEAVRDEDEDDQENANQESSDTVGNSIGTFAIDKANFVNVGKNSYFILEPGYQLVLKDEKATLTITVLNDTKVVDGVETRVVEEREEANDRLTEVSKNYVAIDKTTDSVYYFGEDVDNYKGGKVVNHRGSWLAGVNGAKFGLMMPGKPEVGAKFYQEQAPGKAMDRLEIIAVNEELTTPAGTFKDCLRMRESSDLEKGAKDKIYAPSVGLLKDEEFLLDSHGVKETEKKKATQAKTR
ncbi:MAG: hypothetical protein ACYC3X_04340 [Pirellulaceae bacterium]